MAPLPTGFEYAKQIRLNDGHRKRLVELYGIFEDLRAEYKV